MPPLDGIRVVDFSAAMAGPTCSMLLGDFGADVIKVEPVGGEFGRKWGSDYYGEKKDLSGLFVALNRNKRAVELELKSAEGLANAQALIRSADVVLENFRPGVADRLGVGSEQATRINPRIVYCSISGFGQDGPLRDRPGLDLLLQAYCGHLSVTGEKDRPSVRIGHSAIDLLTGTHAAFGIMLALAERSRTGEGQVVETSLYDSAVHLMTHYIAAYTGSGKVPGKSGSFFAFSAPYGMFMARDREFFMGAADERMYQALCKALGCEHLIDDPRYATTADRIHNRESLHAELMPIFRTRDAQYWVDLCIEARIPTSLVADVAEVVVQEQAKVRDMIIDTGVEGMKSAGIPVKLSATPGTIRSHAPGIGQHNDEVGAEVVGWEQQPREPEATGAP